MDMMEIFEDFINEKRSYCSKRTVDYYRENMEMFFGWMSLISGSHDLKNVDPAVFSKLLFVDYLNFLREKDVKNVSVRTYFRSVKTFCSWMHDNDYIPQNYCSRMKLPKDDSEIQIPLSASEAAGLNAMFDASLYGVRNFCIFHLMLDCGLRCSEVCRLEVSHVNFKKRYIRVLGKGSKIRLLPLPVFLSESMNTYLTLRNRHFPDSGFFFVDRGGAGLTYDCIRDFLYKMKRSSGIDRLHAHLLRHTFATSYLCGGGNLEFLRILLGHATIDITTRYLHVLAVSQVLDNDLYRLDDCYYRFGIAKR